MDLLDHYILVEDFWKNFWPNFLSNIASGIILTYIITKIIQKIGDPKLEIILSITSGSQNRRRLEFYCINTGKTGLMPNEIQWHLYFDESFKLEDKNIDWFISSYKNRNHYMFNGANEKACLPGSSCLLFSISVVINSKEFPYETIDEAPFYYSLTTVKGQKRQSVFYKLRNGSDYIKDSSNLKKRVFKIKKIYF